MGKQDHAGSLATCEQLFSNADLQRCELAALGEWHVVIRSEGPPTIYETYPQGRLAGSRYSFQLEHDDRRPFKVFRRRGVRR